MGRFVIVAYKPKPGMDQQPLAAVAKHLEALMSEHLATDTPAYVMRSADNAIVKYLSGALPRPYVRLMAIQPFKRFGRISVPPVITRL